MLRILGQFKGLLLELRANKGKYDVVSKKYGVLTGEKCEGNKAFYLRKNSGWENAYEGRIYFDANQDVIDGLRKLGINVLENKFSIKMYDGELKQYPYRFHSNEWFWTLVKYGYRLDNNENIPYELYRMRKSLKEAKDIEPFKINNIESENPIYEALLLAS